MVPNSKSKPISSVILPSEGTSLLRKSGIYQLHITKGLLGSALTFDRVNVGDIQVKSTLLGLSFQFNSCCWVTVVSSITGSLKFCREAPPERKPGGGGKGLAPQRSLATGKRERKKPWDGRYTKLKSGYKKGDRSLTESQTQRCGTKGTASLLRLATTWAL